MSTGKSVRRQKDCGYVRDAEAPLYLLGVVESSRPSQRVLVGGKNLCNDHQGEDLGLQGLKQEAYWEMKAPYPTWHNPVWS